MWACQAVTTLDKLQIQGIRSYGANEQPQNIDFKPPLTLILGANGSGKTTIIECLRMSSTGAMPPNANRGASFVNDPKVSKNPTTESKGQIKMRFKTQQGVLVTVGRSFQLTNKKGDKQEVKRLEQYISYGAGSGSSSTTQRCSEIDKLVPEVMGVSPAVLENVIFCHQEDANWVLGEPKVLKDKFDAIFASSRYSKALEAIKTLQGEQKEAVKNLESDEKALAIHKKQAQEHRKDQKGSEEVKLQLVEQGEVDEKQNQLESCEEALSKYEENESKKKEIGTELRLRMSQKAALEEKLEEVFEEDKQELELLAHKTRTTLGTGDEEKAALEAELRKFSTREERCKVSVEKLHSEVVLLQSEQTLHKKQERDRAALAGQLADRYDIDSGIASQGVESSSNSSPMYKRMIDICTSKDVALQKMKRDQENEERKAASEVSAKQRQLDKAEDGLKEKKKRIEEKRAEEAKFCEEMKKTKPANGAEDTAIAEEKTAKELLDKLAGEDGKLSKAVEAVEKEIEKHEADREELTKKKREAEAENTQAIVLKDKMRNYDQQRERVTKTIKDAEERLTSALGGAPRLEDLGSRISAVVEERRRKVEAETSESAKVRSQRERLQEAGNDKNAEIDDLESKIRRMDDAINNLKCDGAPIEAWESRKTGQKIDKQHIDKVLEELEMKCAEKQALHSMAKQLHDMMERYKDIAVKKHKCPLCMRGYDNKDDLEAFVDKLDQKMRADPDKAREEASKLENEVQAVRAIQPKVIEKEQLEARKEEAEQQLEETMKQLKEKEEEEEQVDGALLRAQSALKEATGLEALVKELDIGGMLKLKKELEDEKAKGSGRASGHDLARLENDIENLDRTIGVARKRLKEARSHKDENKEEEKRRMHKYNLARERLKDAKHQVDSYKKLEVLRRQAEDAINQLTIDETEMAKKIPDLKQELKDGEREKSNLQKEHRSAKDKLESEVLATKTDFESLANLERELVKYKKDKKDQDLEQKKESSAKQTDELQAIRKEIEKIKAQLQDKESGEARHREMLRTLEDNIEYKRLEGEVVGLERKLEDLRDELQEYPDKAQVAKKKKELLAEVKKTQGEIDQMKGKMTTLSEGIAKLKETLARKEYVNIDEKYKMKSIEVQTTKCAKTDLDKYYQALDKALMRYHEIKMEEINKIVKEIWQVTYKGDDIDTIQIKADLENTANRRSHNYRLVMRHRHLAELDMRGRCSAGQKVLASLVVRMALAETFCHNCGILALDEPTSNLDERNIQGFTEALSNIVNQRKQQNSRFQLVVISHDKDFIDDLARDTEVPVYYRVEKDPATQSSKITRHDCVGDF